MSLRSSFDLLRDEYLFFGSRSVKENKFLLRRIVFISTYEFSSISSSLFLSSGKNFFDNDSTIGSANIYSQVGL